MEVIYGRYDARAYLTAVIRAMGNAMHLKTSAIMLLENTDNAVTDRMALEVCGQIGNLDLARPLSRQRTNRLRLRHLLPDEVASVFMLPRGTDRQAHESKRRDDALRGRNLRLDDRQ